MRSVPLHTHSLLALSKSAIFAVCILAGSLAPAFGASPFESLAAQDPAEAESEQVSPFAYLAEVPTAVRQAMLDGDHKDALKLLRDLRKRDAHQGDNWAYFIAVTQRAAGDADQAIATLVQLEADFPTSLWLRKSRFLRADMLRDQRRYQEAEEIYEAEAMRLRSKSRQGELAEIYLSFARELSTPHTDATPNEGRVDYNRAATLFSKVLDLGAPKNARAEAMFGMARCYEELRDWNRAANHYHTFLNHFGSGAEAGIAGVRAFEARYREGRCFYHSGNLVKSRALFEDFVALVDGIREVGKEVEPGDPNGDDYPLWRSSMADWPESAHKLLALFEGKAKFAYAYSYQGNDAQNTALRVASLRRFIGSMPSHEMVGKARFEIAQSLMQANQLEDAIKDFSSYQTWQTPSGIKQEIIEENERFRQKSLFLKGQCTAQLKRYSDAISIFNEYVGKYPSGAQWAEAQRAMLDAEYSTGGKYREDGEWQKARQTWTEFLAAHPLDSRAKEIAYDLGGLYIDMAREGDDERRAWQDPGLSRLYRSAIADWDNLAQKYPGSESASRALYFSGLYMETELLELERSIEYYRRCSFGSYSGKAVARLREMTKPSLAIETERAWRTDEVAKVKVHGRNTEKLSVRVYDLDLEAYFRKHLTHQKIEDLDLDLIAPDQEFEVSIADYAEYKPIEQDVEIPVKGAGVWAVSIDDGERRATTLVVRSDIDIIAKTSRREVFIYAQDMRLNEPASDVEVLLALPSVEGGNTLLRTLETGRDGVAKIAIEELIDASNVRILASRKGNFASNGLTMGGLSLSAGLKGRGYIYTGRSAYRPGQLVHWRAVLREANGDSYSFKPGSTYSVTIFDPQGQEVSRRKVVLSEFGTLNEEFLLNRKAPLGQYRISCRSGQGIDYQGKFEVRDFQLKSIDLAIEFDQDVYYRGEVVRGTATAAYYYGEPVAGSPIRLELPNDRQLKLVTDENGQAKFEIQTRDITGFTRLNVSAMLSEENVASSGNTVVAVHGYSTSMTMPRHTVLAGSTFTVKILASDAAGNPVAREMEMEVLRRERSRRNTWQDIPINKFTINTKEDGHARQALSLEKGGTHLFRLTGTDRFGNPIVSESTIEISGDDDAQRVRVLSETTYLAVGNELEVNIHNRAEPGFALLTFEGETMLDYKIVNLEEGSNPFKFEMDHNLYPNFRLAASLMRENKFHTADADFELRRKLTVKLTPSKEVVQPGEMAAVALEVVDQLGRPVEAEMSLAVVDESIFDQYNSRLPAIGAFFVQDARRSIGFNTVSSCTFLYRGQTVEIAAAILEETARLQADLKWEEDRLELKEELGKAHNYKGPGDILPPSSGAAPSPPSPRTATGLEFRFGKSAGEDSDLLPEELLEPEGSEWGTAIRLGGGGGGKYGGRGGAGRRNRAEGQAGYLGIEALGYLDAGPDLDDAEAMNRWANAGLALWVPAVVTDKNGKATVSFQVPPRSSEWRITCKGTTKQTLLGQAESSLISRDDFFAEIQAPLSLVEGDQPEFRVRVHNMTEETGLVNMQLRLSGGEFQLSLPGQVTFTEDSNLQEYSFQLPEPVSHVGDLKLEVMAIASFGEETFEASTSKVVRVKPWGVQVADYQSGVLASEASFTLQLPRGQNYKNRTLELTFGSQLQGLVIDAALGRRAFEQYRLAYAAPTYADVASDLLGICAVLEWLEGNGGQADPSDHARLWRRAEGLVAHLTSTQNPDGGWNWTGIAKRSSEAETSARSMHALGVASERGLAVSPQAVSKGLDFLQGQFKQASQSQQERKAILLHAMAWNGNGDFGALNRLHRLRNSLPPAALAYSGLAFARMERTSMAAELAQLLIQKMDRNGSCMVVGNQAWSRSRIEMTALASLLLQQTSPSSTEARKFTDYLINNRPWRAGRDRGLAVSAVSLWLGKTKQKVDPFDVKVTLNGKPMILGLGGKTNFTGFLEEGFDHDKAEIKLQVSGRGRPYFQAVLSGVSDKVEEKHEAQFRITRYLFAAEQPIYKGKKIPIGFDVVNDQYRDNEWVNQVENLSLGGMTRVDLQYHRNFDRGEAPEAVDYLTMRIPIPAGTTVLQGSMTGNFLHHEVHGNEILLNIGQRRGSGHLGFTLVGVLPGQFRVLPCRLESAQSPNRYALSKPQNMTVLPRGESRSDDYKSTPSELYYLGIAMLESGDDDGGYELLSQLYEDFGAKLKDNHLATIAGRLLFLAIERSKPSEIVRYFEVLKEKNPALNVPFEKVLAVGKAYRELEEFERALLVFRATIEETFGKDLKVAGALDEQQEPHGALVVMERLWLEFPDLPVVTETYLALSDKMLALAPNAHKHPALLKAGLDRSELTLAGVHLLQRFIALFPEDALAAEAALNLVSAFLEIDEFETSSRLSTEFAAKFNEPSFADAFHYTDAVSRWYLGKGDQAMSILEGIANASYALPNGGSKPSENRDLALYILAQIHHARQDFDSAKEYYAKVDKVFADAREVLDGFQAKSIALDEVTSTAPGKSVELELRHRHVEEAELLVYAVDLMTLYLRERNLSQITSVNLAGIAPTLRKTVKLKPEIGMLERKTKVKLDLKKPGAYLVICRGDELHTSGLALVSDIELEVKEDAVSGRLRIQARDQSDHKFVRDVDVRVVGSGGGDFISGRTDPRGLYIADGLLGTSTVIARFDSKHYAFFRGRQALGRPQEKSKKGTERERAQQLDAGDYFDNVLQLNENNIQQRALRLKDQIGASRKGVRVEQAR